MRFEYALDLQGSAWARARFFVGWIDRLIAAVKEKGRFEEPAQRDEVVRLFERARAFYEQP